MIWRLGITNCIVALLISVENANRQQGLGMPCHSERHSLELRVMNTAKRARLSLSRFSDVSHVFLSYCPSIPDPLKRSSLFPKNLEFLFDRSEGHV